MTEIISIFMFYLPAAFIAIQILDILLAFKSDKSFPPIAMACNFSLLSLTRLIGLIWVKIPRSSPASLRKTPSFPTLLTRFVFYFKKFLSTFFLFVMGCFLEGPPKMAIENSKWVQPVLRLHALILEPCTWADFMWNTLNGHNFLMVRDFDLISKLRARI